MKRPGVDVRARRGYRAATAEEVAAARSAGVAPVPEIASAVGAALGALDRVRAGTRFYLHAVHGPAEGAGASKVWIAGEFQPASGPDPWASGGTADLEVSVGGASATAQVALAAGSRAFVTLVTLPSPVAAGFADVRARLAGTAAAAERINQSIRLDMAAPGHALLFGRGPSTGNRFQPVATFQFSRTERLRLESPAGADATIGAARLLGKTGQPVGVPIAVGDRMDDAGGQRWLTADLVLAPLAMGDYAIELTFTNAGGEQRVITPFRLTR